jgi:hypothetical protein
MKRDNHWQHLTIGENNGQAANPPAIPPVRAASLKFSVLLSIDFLFFSEGFLFYPQIYSGQR